MFLLSRRQGIDTISRQLKDNLNTVLSLIILKRGQQICIVELIDFKRGGINSKCISQLLQNGSQYA